MPDWYTAEPISKGATKRAKIKKAKKRRKDGKLAKLASVARDSSLPTPIRLNALVQLDERAGKSAGLKEGQLVLKKSARKRLERQALNSADVHVRQRALDAMFPW